MDKIDEHRIYVDDKYKRSINLDIEYDGRVIRLGTYSTDSGMRDPKIRAMMFRQLEKLFVKHINNDGLELITPA